MKILGIETSCDETAAAVITTDGQILSNIIYSQLEHEKYGGVVPELAARAHLKHINDIVDRALNGANLWFDDIDAISVTAGPGLIGGVIIGVMAAKSYASVHQKPLIAINHLEGHALTVRLTNNVKFPYLLLLISGGHCQILAVEGVGKYKLIGKTIDDSLGEAFDKCAKMMNLSYPGGVEIERFAKTGKNIYKFPKPLCNKDNCDFSFSGLKTAVRRELEKEFEISGELLPSFKANIATSFQTIVAEILTIKMSRAINIFKQNHDSNGLVIAGGVAANKYIAGAMQTLADEQNMQLFIPPTKLCTDNAAMIAWAGCEYINDKSAKPYIGLDIEPKARWNLYD